MNREGQCGEEERLETDETPRSEESNLIHNNSNSNSSSDNGNHLPLAIDKERGETRQSPPLLPFVSPLKTSSLFDGHTGVGMQFDLEQETISDTSSSTSTASSPSFQSPSTPSSPPSPATLIAFISEASRKGQSDLIPEDRLGDVGISPPSTPLRSPRSINGGNKRKTSSSATSDDDYDQNETFVTLSLSLLLLICIS